ncbi:MAG: LysR family transcriptional regulator [Rhodobacteraceae bacterium]|jgi:DNA-binding transcriptional LysR family regulator|nr:LysR family transcriptional regulator [Paracoccaceae bacterium]
MRYLDLATLRSLVAIAEHGGVTRAAVSLGLTQSAVSMQIKRMEDALQVQLLDRSARKVALTASGQQLCDAARRILADQDAALARLTHAADQGTITLGVPHDIVYPVIPPVLRQFARDYPRMRVQLVSSYSAPLLAQFTQGACDLVLTTEQRPATGAEVLAELPLVWVGAPGGRASRQRPLPLAYEHQCLFRADVQAALDAAGIPWVMAVESASTRSVEASVMADLAVHTVLAGSMGTTLERIRHDGNLPDLGRWQVNLYQGVAARRAPHRALADLLRKGFARLAENI